MKKQYVPKTLSEYLGESNSITLKRKYGERMPITAGTNAPLRNQVLSFVAESGSVSKRDLKQYILGLKEGGSTIAAANMFIKRNAKYFLMESRNGVTYFKLSNLGKRLVNQFVPTQDANVSESVKIARNKLSAILEQKRALKEQELPEEELEDELPDEELEGEELQSDFPEDVEADEIDGEGPAEEVEFDEDRFSEEPEEGEEGDHDESDNFEYEEDDEKITLTYYKNGSGAEDELEGEELPEDELEDENFEDEDELEGEEFPEDELPEDELEEDVDRPVDEPREYDFKDKGRPGVYDMDESAKPMRAQFVSHKLAGTAKSKLAGRYSTAEYHNLLDDNEDKDEQEFKNYIVKSKKTGKLDEDKDENELKNLDNEITEAYYGKMMPVEEFERFIDSLIKLNNKEKAIIKLRMLFDKYPEMHAHVGEIPGQDEYKSGLIRFKQFYYKRRRSFESVQVDECSDPKLGGKIDADTHNLLDKEDKDENELKDFDDEITESEAIKEKMKSIVENLKAKRKKLIKEAEEPTESDELSDEDLDTVDTEAPAEEPVEDETGTTLDDEGVEKVEITEFIITVDNVDEAIDELTELGVTAERVPVEPKEEELPAEVEEPEMPEEQPTDELAPAEEAPAEPEVKESIQEAEEPDLGSSDELGLGDQGEEAPELDQPAEGGEEETVEPTTEFEENKIKVKAEDWPVLKTWLEEKGVDVTEMFGGDIEMEEVSPEEEMGEEGAPVEEPISDEDIDFSGVGEEDTTKVEEE
jgi:hypothetical protein